MRAKTRNSAVEFTPAAAFNGPDFLRGTSVEHGLSVGMFRENTGRHWSGFLPA